MNNPANLQCTIDSISGGLATDLTPEETREEIPLIEPHTILHWLNKNDPLGNIPKNPESDSQYDRWEGPVQNWINQNKFLVFLHRAVFLLCSL